MDDSEEEPEDSRCPQREFSYEALKETIDLDPECDWVLPNIYKAFNGEEFYTFDDCCDRTMMVQPGDVLEQAARFVWGKHVGPLDALPIEMEYFSVFKQELLDLALSEGMIEQTEYAHA